MARYRTSALCPQQDHSYDADPCPICRDYVGTTFPLDKPDDEPVTVVVMDFFLNDIGTGSFYSIKQTWLTLNYLRRWAAVNAVNKLDPAIQLNYSAFKPYGDPKVQLKDIWGIYAQKFWQVN